MTATVHDPTTWTATRIRSSVASGRASAAEVLRAHLARLDRLNPSLAAVTSRRDDEARRDAAAIDDAVARGDAVGPLAGVPVTVKETTDVAGLATTHGLRAFADRVARVDAPPVDRLRRAGAVVIGHTNMPTLTLTGMHPRSELFGDTVNPWDPHVTPGGSSGGDAVAVAAGLAACGLGNDSGGSTRLPAQFCGVAGLKPTPGRVPADHRIGSADPSPAAALFPVDGPLARTVADLRAVFDVLAGADPRDPRAVPAPLRGPELARTVGIVRDPGGHGVDRAVVTALDDAAQALADSGYHVVEAEVPMLDEALEVYTGMVLTEFAGNWPAISALVGPEASRYIDFDLDEHPPLDLEGYLDRAARQLTVRRAWAQRAVDTPLLLGPVSTRASFAPGQESSSAEQKRRFGRSMTLATWSTAVGAPAVAVPTGLVDGRPVGVQLIGPAWREDVVFDAAQAIEDTCGVLTPMEPVANRT
ncbi:indole acetimide hydrolase [Saccharomonospora piscinae]|uniref:Indole acetimide hydrolase n=1 Tax=Saccharomonospora piscinae TaxID=687388 RepID=A0A1V8ZWY6_SACPI|nr:amidase [Saccharomonospora piscinae]OQO89467.1 indole acetimide hydrolase [Saccharomonospora piscinae]TLW91159.1 indole acetimide hydrolase [Saccharomonospora piscinae]